MDAVPRLSSGTLQRFSQELSSCALRSADDLDVDLQHYVERLSSVWAPRVREGRGVPVGHGEGSGGLPWERAKSPEDEEEELWKNGHLEEEVDLHLGEFWKFCWLEVLEVGPFGLKDEALAQVRARLEVGMGWWKPQRGDGWTRNLKGSNKNWDPC